MIDYTVSNILFGVMDEGDIGGTPVCELELASRGKKKYVLMANSFGLPQVYQTPFSTFELHATTEDLTMGEVRERFRYLNDHHKVKEIEDVETIFDKKSDIASNDLLKAYQVLAYLTCEEDEEFIEAAKGKKLSAIDIPEDFLENFPDED